MYSVPRQYDYTSYLDTLLCHEGQDEHGFMHCGITARLKWVLWDDTFQQVSQILKICILRKRSRRTAFSFRATQILWP